MADSDDIEMVLGDEENASAPNTLDEQQQQQHRDVQVTSPAVMEETIREDDDNDDQQQQQKQQHPSQGDKDLSPPTTTALGGIVDTPCFCLLDGIIDLTPTTSSNNKDESTTEKQIERLSVPITHLPAVLGRAHQTNDENFIPLGTFTTISRQHCKIEYWCNSTGRLEQQKQQQESKSNDDKSNEEATAEFLYVPQKEKGFKFSNKNKKVTDKPFYTITYLGKNRIFVDKEKLEKGETAVLSNGAAIRLSNTCFLYFLLPTKSSTKTLEIIMEPPPPTKKRKTTSSSSSSFTVTSSGLTAKGSSGGGNKSTTAATTTAPKRGRGVSHIQAELDKLSNDELRRQLTAAIQDDIWERRHQLIGSTLSGRAILAVAHDPTLRQKCQRDQGLSRGEIMDWIAASDEFAEWSQQMLNKLEIKSYQSSITKAMIKAGFTRTASTGRYIKWMLPDMKMNAVTGKVQNKSTEQVDDAEDKTTAQEGSGVDEADYDKEDEEDKHDESKEESEQADKNESDNENEEDEANDGEEHEDSRDEGSDKVEQETQAKNESCFNKKVASSVSGTKQDDEEVVSWSIREP